MDELKIVSKMTRALVSKLLEKKLREYGINAEIDLGDVHLMIVDGKVKLLVSSVSIEAPFGQMQDLLL